MDDRPLHSCAGKPLLMLMCVRGMSKAILFLYIEPVFFRVCCLPSCDDKNEEIKSHLYLLMQMISTK